MSAMVSRPLTLGLAVGAVLGLATLVLLALTFIELRAMRSSLDRTENRIVAMQGDFRPLADEATPLLRSGRPLFDRAGRDMESLAGSVPRMQGAIDEIAASIDPILSAVSTLRVLPGMAEDIRRLRDDMAGLRSQIAVVRDDMAGLRGELGSMRRDIGGLRGAVADVRDDVKALPASLLRVERGVGAVAPKLSPLPEVRDNLGTTVTILQDMRTHLRSLDRKLGGTWR